VAGALALAACAAFPPAVPEDPALELTQVPFFPQTAHQCGPAALATVLTWSGASTTPEALTPQVYIPSRQGSLAVELVAATRRAGRIPWQPDLEADGLIAEVRAGDPVLVLQDLGIAWIHVWHYAVVIGYEPDRDVFILRSGTNRRSLESRQRFLDRWERGERWALLALPPGRLPAGATPEGLVRTVESSREFLPEGAPGQAYAVALTRWPDDPTLLFAAANEDYGAGRLTDAERLYRHLLAGSPGHVAGRNNLANLLLDRGCPAAAADAAREALAELDRSPDDNHDFRGAVEETQARALALERTRPSQEPCGRGASPDLP
jgi:hypothetical protein